MADPQVGGLGEEGAGPGIPGPPGSRQTSPAPAADPGLSGGPDNLPLPRGPLPPARLTLDPSKPRSLFPAPPPPLQTDVNPSAAGGTSKARLSPGTSPEGAGGHLARPPPTPRSSPHVSFGSESGYPQPIPPPRGTQGMFSALSFSGSRIQAPSHRLQEFRSLGSPPTPPPPPPRSQAARGLRVPPPSGTPGTGAPAPSPPLPQTHGSAAPASEGTVSRAGPGPAAAGCSPSSARLRARRPLPGLRVPASLLPTPPHPRPRPPGAAARLPAPDPAAQPPPRGAPAPAPPAARPSAPGFPRPRRWPRSRGKNSIQPGGGAGGGGRGREAGRGA